MIETLASKPVITSVAPAQHCTEDEWVEYCRANLTEGSAKSEINARRRFVKKYPDLHDWLSEPLEQRLGRLRGEGINPSSHTNNVSYRARGYIMYLSITGRLALPADFLVMTELQVTQVLNKLGNRRWVSDIQALAKRASLAGWNEKSTRTAITYFLTRLCLQRADFSSPVKVSSADFEQFRAVTQSVFATANPNCNLKWKGNEDRLGKAPLSAAFQAHRVYFQFGLVDEPPHRGRPSVRTLVEAKPSSIARAFDAWLNYDRSRGTADRTLSNRKRELQYFVEFASASTPPLESLRDLHRGHINAYLDWLSKKRSTRKPHDILDASTRRAALSTLKTALEEMWDFEIAPVPSRSLIHSADFPKASPALPRFLPPEQVSQIERAIEKLSDPYHAAALKIARASGARRDEIRRLSIDCLGASTKGAPNLLIPAGKNNRERIVPITESAAEAVRTIQALRANDEDRPIYDKVAKTRVRFLFLKGGRLLSAGFLFDQPLAEICLATGLLTIEGRKLVTAHRFRHTLGTELAEAGARFQSIMAILGHESADMTLIYAKLSDKSVRDDYEKALKAGALAGPAAKRILSNTLSDRERDLLDHHYYRTEFGLGNCIRLPEEGPCECELYLTCTKFFTTPAHAPRLRGKYEAEMRLVREAATNGWSRMAENAQAKAKVVHELLNDLGESIDGPVAPLSPA
jgi:integrase